MKVLSAVLGREVTDFQKAGSPNDLAIRFKDGVSYSSFDTCININDLMIKCIEYIFDKYGIYLSVSLGEDSSDGKFYTCNFKMNKELKSFYDTTASESVFNACEYIIGDSK